MAGCMMARDWHLVAVRTQGLRAAMIVHNDDVELAERRSIGKVMLLHENGPQNMTR